mgnify:CR=1 FL=1
MKTEEAIFNHWNSQPDHVHWRTHRIFTPGMANAVKQWLKEGYTADYLCQAINNYYECRTTKGTWWHDVCKIKWDFETFFKGGKRKTEYNWKRFETERFELWDAYTDAHKRVEIQKRRKQQTPPEEQEERYVDLHERTDYIKLLEENPDSPFYRAMAEKMKK